MERYICIHGHFYQPPRENAWLESIEVQDSAYPYHDWNERITAECYAPNTASRILDGEGYITKLVNNYSKISFNFGPTLLYWLKDNHSDIYQAILEADRLSQENFSGHGSAMAQAYNHMIMPLANRRDKYTQVVWGIADFGHRFGRKPEGMWLPETAVDLETLDIMAEQGIKFTVLAPTQASRVRRIGADDWEDVSDASIDPTMAYRLNLPSGREIALFFYDGPISRNIAFEDTLDSGEKFAYRLTDAFSEERDWPQLVHIATDGETYGHHHRFGDMALAFALEYIEANNLAAITNYGEYLEKNPCTYEVEIFENTSWSCTHGVERWRSDCGDNSGGNPNWNQAWRTPLREALDWLRDALEPKYEEAASQLLNNPWAVRDDYISVVLNRATENINEFMARHSLRELSEAEIITVLKLLELQRHVMLMYTSCGWFFDELFSLETVQVIQYAGRAVQLAQELWGNDFEADFLERLELAKSNIPENKNGRKIYEEFVKPAAVDLIRVAAHFAVSSLFEEYGEQSKINCYLIDIRDYHMTACGSGTWAAGLISITSDITAETADISFGVLHFGDHNLNAGVREYQGEEEYQMMVAETTQACAIADFPEVIRLLDKHFGMSTYSLKGLFRDEQRKVLHSILESSLSDIEDAYLQVYERHFPPMRFLSELGYPIPKSLRSAAEFFLNSSLRKVLAADELDLERLRNLLEETQNWEIEPNTEELSYLLQQIIEGMMNDFSDAPDNMELLQKLADVTATLTSLPFPVELWWVQNTFSDMLGSAFPDFKQRAEAGDEAAKEWLDLCTLVGQQISVRVG